MIADYYVRRDCVSYIHVFNIVSMRERCFLYPCTEKGRADVILSWWMGRKVPFPDTVACIYGLYKSEERRRGAQKAFCDWVSPIKMKIILKMKIY